DQVEIMADCSSLEDVEIANRLDFDYIGTTLYGYAKETKGKKIYDHDFQFVKDVIRLSHKPVIAEGNIETPEMMAKAFELGAYSVVVGSAMTRPQIITEKFAKRLSK